ncbi:MULTISPECIES: hypothetical protein [unclassified Paenibacillus]|uniref:hypothetical protein n=1 Tax=unclassified Paenibacillus TaxID=185978 RepID=UPI00020D6AB2|nr:MULTISPECIES: hypothetical protein [unclassified Paenibacillus]EGL13993.1 hypothetical protein HMPREF9413_2009 [Paenibacillus sp. HGF7]EPD90132.1 hypothetical protein HMPREF1207_01401 [Paenibacillus sp. HGH0039]
MKRMTTKKKPSGTARGQKPRSRMRTRSGNPGKTGAKTKAGTSLKGRRIAELAAAGRRLGGLLAAGLPVRSASVDGDEAGSCRTDEAAARRQMNDLWARHGGVLNGLNPAGPEYAAAASAFAQGYCERAGLPDKGWFPFPSDQRVSAVILLHGSGPEAFAVQDSPLLRLLGELERLALHEVILASRDEAVTPQLVQSFAAPRLGAEVKLVGAGGVSAGTVSGGGEERPAAAEAAEGDILVFLDASVSSAAEEIAALAGAIARGSDAALCGISAQLPLFHKRPPEVMAKQFVNYALGRRDLQADSLTVLPHALSRQAVTKLGAELAHPAKAHGAALIEGLAVSSVRLSGGDTRSARGVRPFAWLDRSRASDHLEALGLAMERLGPRLFYPDNWRRRGYAAGADSPGIAEEPTVSGDFSRESI